MGKSPKTVSKQRPKRKEDAPIPMTPSKATSKAKKTYSVESGRNGRSSLVIDGGKTARTYSLGASNSAMVGEKTRVRSDKASSKEYITGITRDGAQGYVGKKRKK